MCVEGDWMMGALYSPVTHSLMSSVAEGAAGRWGLVSAGSLGHELEECVLVLDSSFSLCFLAAMR